MPIIHRAGKNNGQTARGKSDMARDYVIQSEPRAEAPAGFEKFMKVFVIIAILFLAGELVWLLGARPFMPFSGIDISGGEASLNRDSIENSSYFGITRSEILAKAGLTGESSYFSTRAHDIEKALLEFSTLESVRVIKRFPDRLKIIMEGRRAVAVAFAELGGKTVPVLFDSQGVVFEVGANKQESAPQNSLAARLPVLSGLVIEEPFPGMRLPPFFIPLFRELEKIQLSSPELLAAVSELRINPRTYNSFDFLLYPMHKKVKVHLSELNEDLLRYTLLMVDVLAAKDPAIDSLDFRSGIASYIPKEVSSE